MLYTLRKQLDPEGEGEAKENERRNVMRGNTEVGDWFLGKLCVRRCYVDRAFPCKFLPLFHLL